MPEIQMREASNSDWPFINLLCTKELKHYLNAMWPYQPKPSQFFKLNQSKFKQGRTTIINYDGIDIGMYSLKHSVNEIEIEKISLWFDTDEQEIANLIIEDIVENKLHKGAVARCSLEHESPLLTVYESYGFKKDYETDHRVYLRLIK